jgi:formiminotetrahydrofolate cyclodeaminase
LLAHLKIKEYLEKVAAGTAVPGGGSVAALNAALATGLAEMVANLTLGKKGYEAVEAEMKDIAGQAAELRLKVTAAIDRDAEAYSEVMAAFKLPRSNDREKSARQQAIQHAFKHAALVPLEVAQNAIKTLDLIERAVRTGNKNAATDGAVAALNARAASLSALYNVKINLVSIEDEQFVEKIAAEVKGLEAQIGAKEEKILSSVGK